jgi:Uma2 family endonuclease
VPTAFRFTSKDLEAMPQIEGVRYEIIDGELYVATAPHFHHQYAADRISAPLQAWNDAHGSGIAATAPGMVFAEDQNVIPDLIWISNGRYERALDEAGHLTVAPELVVEVLSPGSQNEFRDRDIKLGLYSRQGVDESWIVDWHARLVEMYRRAEGALRLVATLTSDDTLTSPLLSGFECAVSSLWTPAPPDS